MHDHAGVLADSEAQELRVRRADLHQAREAAALQEVAVNDHVLDESEAGGHVDRALAQRIGGRSIIDHRRRQRHRPGARPGHHGAGLVALANGGEDGGAAEHVGQAKLIAPGEENAAGLLDSRDAVRIARLLALANVEGVDGAGPDAREGLLIRWKDLLGVAAGRRDHDDLLVVRGRQRDDAGQDFQVGRLVLRAANGDEMPLWPGRFFYHFLILELVSQVEVATVLETSYRVAAPAATAGAERAGPPP